MPNYVKQIEFSSSNTLILYEDGSVGGVGDNTYGQLGIYNEKTYFSSPTLLTVVNTYGFDDIHIDENSAIYFFGVFGLITIKILF